MRVEDAGCAHQTAGHMRRDQRGVIVCRVSTVYPLTPKTSAARVRNTEGGLEILWDPCGINDFLSLHLNLTILVLPTDCISSRHKWTAHSHLSHFSVHTE